AGGGRGRPRAAGFLQVSSSGALPCARVRSAARGEGAPGGARRELGDFETLLAPPPAGPRRGGRPHAAATEPLAAAGKSATPP
ncbi:hypothetical protein P7K49_036885, partial [Saguinus oedipus]